MAFTHINPETPIRGQRSFLGVATTENLVTGPGRVFTVVVQVAPSSTAYILDSGGTTQASTNTILPIPTTAVVGEIFQIDCPYFVGLSIVVSGGTFNIICD